MTPSEISQIKEYFVAIAEAEKAVGEFYSLCFEYWPEEQLWRQLAEDEKRHSAVALRMLSAVEAAPGAFLLARPLNLAPVKLFIQAIQDYKGKVRAGVYRKINALSVSRDLEQSIIESRYDQIVKSSDQGYNRAAAVMVADTKLHKEAFVARLSTLGILK